MDSFECYGDAVEVISYIISSNFFFRLHRKVTRFDLWNSVSLLSKDIKIPLWLLITVKRAEWKGRKLKL